MSTSSSSSSSSGDDFMGSSGFSMLELFRSEAEGQTQTLSNGLVAYESAENPSDLLAEMMRAAHSLKGAARIVNLGPAERVAHMMEDVFVAAQEARVSLGAAQVDDLLLAVDFLTRLRDLQEHEVESWKQSVKGEVAVLEARLSGMLEADSADASLSRRALTRRREDDARPDPAPKEEEKKETSKSDAAAVGSVSESSSETALPHDDSAVENGEFSLFSLFRQELGRHVETLDECIRIADESHSAMHVADPGTGTRDSALEQEMIQTANAIRSSAQIAECTEVQELAAAMELCLTRWKAAGMDLATQRSSLVRVALKFFRDISVCPDAEFPHWLDSNREAMHEAAFRLRSPGTGVSESEEPSPTTPGYASPVAPAASAGAAAPLSEAHDPAHPGTISAAAPHHQAIPAKHLGKMSQDIRESHSREVAAAMTPRNDATVRISAELLSSLTGLAAEILVGARQMESLALQLTTFRQEQNHLAALLSRMQSGAVVGEGVKMGLTTGEQSALVDDATLWSAVAAAKAAEFGKAEAGDGFGPDASVQYPSVTGYLHDASPPFIPSAGHGASSPGANAKGQGKAAVTISSTFPGDAGVGTPIDGMSAISMRGPRGYLLAELTRAMGANNETLAGWMQEFDSYMHRFGNTADRLYQAVLSTRMRPFGDGTHGFPRLVRDLARQLGKKVRMQILGEETRVDREILEKLEAPLTHLIRNALDHGLETPEERRALGKPDEGVLRLEARHRGGVLVVTLSDDGHGICIASLREKVVERGLETADVVARLSEAEVMEFLFLPGFSTATRVTDVSGRGVGLDVVRHVVQVAGGSVSVHARENQGTTFQISVPITRSVIKALLVRVADEPYALPLARIDKTALVPQSELDSMEGRLYLCCEQYGNVGLVSAQEILKLPAHLPPQKAADVNIVVISDRMNRYGLVVDEFLGARDLVVRPLDSRLGKVPDISSASVMEDGKIALVLDVDDLVRSIDTLLSGGGLRRIHQAEAPAARNVPRILVVDDSITVREAERRLLENHGYAVDVAVDGMEGWNMVRSSKYDLVVTDVDMPRMTGIDLVRKIKEDVRLKQLPVMIVSYKDRPEDRAEGLDAGADHYFPKSSFHDAGLVSAVEDLIGKAV